MSNHLPPKHYKSGKLYGSRRCRDFVLILEELSDSLDRISNVEYVLALLPNGEIVFCYLDTSIRKEINEL